MNIHFKSEEELGGNNGSIFFIELANERLGEEFMSTIDPMTEQFEIDGHILKARYRKNKNFHYWKRSILVTNMNWKTDEADLENFFYECGEILRLHILRNKDGNSKG